MIVEIAKIQIKDGQEAAFEEAMADSAPLFRRAEGCGGVAIRRSAEKPSQYWLLIRWDSVEHHTKIFAASEDFKTFITRVGPCFAAAPQVDHAEETWTGF